jgi:hypothetical protein
MRNIFALVVLALPAIAASAKGIPDSELALAGISLDVT